MEITPAKNRFPCLASQGQMFLTYQIEQRCLRIDSHRNMLRRDLFTIRHHGAPHTRTWQI